MSKMCPWYDDFGGVCCNAASVYVADICPHDGDNDGCISMIDLVEDAQTRMIDADKLKSEIEKLKRQNRTNCVYDEGYTCALSSVEEILKMIESGEL